MKELFKIGNIIVYRADNVYLEMRKHNGKVERLNTHFTDTYGPILQGIYSSRMLGLCFVNLQKLKNRET